jgi:hypothetical protein
MASDVKREGVTGRGSPGVGSALRNRRLLSYRKVALCLDDARGMVGVSKEAADKCSPKANGRYGQNLGTEDFGRGPQ